MTSGNADEVETGLLLPMWEDAGLLDSFARWHPAAVAFYRPAYEAMLAAAGVGPGTRLLDVGTGTGIPALPAAMVVGPAGSVVATDPSAGMLRAAEANARAAGVANVAFRRAAAEALPFPDGAFDAVVSQLGLMFAADLPRALGETRRVLRPGGRAAFIAWGPYAGNPFWTAFWNVQERYAAEVAAASPAPDGGAEPDDRAEAREAVDTDGAEPAAPDPRGPFRFAEEGSLLGALRAAGFADAREEVLRVALPASSPDPLAAFWLTDDATLNALPAARQSAFREEVAAAYRAFADGDGDGILVPAVFVLGSGAAP